MRRGIFRIPLAVLLTAFFWWISPAAGMVVLIAFLVAGIEEIRIRRSRRHPPGGFT